MNEGYASNLIGSPDTVRGRIREFQEIGVDMLHLSLNDDCFNTEVLPHVKAM
jgi:alkanesulfonate monooxygenase SsuD/methylene tetrahydromethanopterin reductase-like flavin-dependent oxidoreductase (luciferase family)